MGPGRDGACLASDDAGIPFVESPSAIEADFVPADEADWEAIATVDRTQFGQSVASAGDVDRYWGEDIIVGAPFGVNEDTGEKEGFAYLFLNTAGAVEETAAWEKSGGVKGALFGWSVAGAGNVNGDECDDVIIGAPNYKTEFQVGRAFVYQGVQGVGLSDEPIWGYTGTVQDGEVGFAVAGAGNLNGDDYDDIVVGARGEDAIYVFYGSSSGPSEEPDWHVLSDQAGAWFGAAVGAAGDVNGDGYDDLIVGAPKYENPETGLKEGAVFVFLGRETGADPPASVADADWMVHGAQGSSNFGMAVAGAGDVNGDGRPEIFVGAPEYVNLAYGGQVGAAFSFCWGESGLGNDPCWTAFGGYIGGRFGLSVGSAGDVNADGYDEVIVGAPHHFHDLVLNRPEGAAFVYFGSETGLSPLAGWKARGNKARTDLGASVGLVGLATGEADSVLIGAPQYFKYESEPYGAAFAFYGPLEPAPFYHVFLPLILRSSD